MNMYQVSVFICIVCYNAQPCRLESFWDLLSIVCPWPDKNVRVVTSVNLATESRAQLLQRKTSVHCPRACQSGLQQTRAMGEGPRQRTQKTRTRIITIHKIQRKMLKKIAL